MATNIYRNEANYVTLVARETNVTCSFSDLVLEWSSLKHGQSESLSTPRLVTPTAATMILRILSADACRFTSTYRWVGGAAQDTQGPGERRFKDIYPVGMPTATKLCSF